MLQLFSLPKTNVKETNVKAFICVFYFFSSLLLPLWRSLYIFFWVKVSWILFSKGNPQIFSEVRWITTVHGPIETIDSQKTRFGYCLAEVTQYFLCHYCPCYHRNSWISAKNIILFQQFFICTYRITNSY